MWNTLDRGFLSIDYIESKYRHFSTKRMKHGERMTVYLDELVRLYRKARPGTFIQFQNEEVKNRLISGLSPEVLSEVQGYLDLTAAEITRKYDLLHSQWDTLGISMTAQVDKVLNVTQAIPSNDDEKSFDDIVEQIYAFQSSDRKNKYKDETCTFCQRKGHTENVCFAKKDEAKLEKFAMKCASSMQEVFLHNNDANMKDLCDKLEHIVLKVKG